MPLYRGSPLGTTVGTAELENEAVTAAKIAGTWIGASQAGVAALNTTRTPSATRPVLVMAVVNITVDSAGDDGKVQLRVEDVDPPTINESEIVYLGNDGTPSRAMSGLLIAIVPKGQEYRLVTTASAGTPVFTFIRCREWVL